MKHYSPTTPGLRHKIISNFPKSLQKRSLKQLHIHWHKKKGRNNLGKKTSLYHGGGHKQIYRNIDFWYANYGKDATLALITNIQIDSFRSSYIASIVYLDGKLKGHKRYILLTKDLNVGSVISFGKSAPITIGNSKPIYTLPLGTQLHSIEQYPFKGANLVRSAGTFAKLITLDSKYAIIKLPSGEIRKIDNQGYAVIGSVSHVTNKQQHWGKAGSSRHRSIRPKVRGMAMNAVDHPHGGGEGKSPIGHKAARSRWGIYKKGIKTRYKTKKSTKLILQKRK